MLGKVLSILHVRKLSFLMENEFKLKFDMTNHNQISNLKLHDSTYRNILKYPNVIEEMYSK